MKNGKDVSTVTMLKSIFKWNIYAPSRWNMNILTFVWKSQLSKPHFSFHLALSAFSAVLCKLSFDRHIHIFVLSLCVSLLYNM